MMSSNYAFAALAILIILIIWWVASRRGGRPPAPLVPAPDLTRQILALQYLSGLYYQTLVAMDSGSIRQGMIEIYEIMGKTSQWQQNATHYKELNDNLMAHAGAFNELKQKFDAYRPDSPYATFEAQAGYPRYMEQELAGFVQPPADAYVNFWSEYKGLVNTAEKSAGDTAAQNIQSELAKASQILSGIVSANEALLAKL